ncbi:MAG: mannitol dehydrogenase family protein [Pseudomonadota bacterium]
MDKPRLTTASLGYVHPGVSVPAYARESVQCGIVHLGVGNFHRAHQAVYCEDVLSHGDFRWGICGVSLRSSKIRDRLSPQDGLYTVIEKDGREQRPRIIGAIKEVLSAPENPVCVLDRLTDPATKIVSLTITEKGYARSSGRDVDWEPSKLCNQEAPALLFLVEALWRRWKAGGTLFTVLSCDNLAKNGEVLKQKLCRIAFDRDREFSHFLEQRLASPSTMVDRIVPQTSLDDIDDAAERLGVLDAALVPTEPFRQWIIEDNFPLGRPAWDDHGATFVANVAPYEKMKLRLLNGAHTFMALFGQLTDTTYVHEVAARGDVGRFLSVLWASAEATLAAEFDYREYQRALRKRFLNSALQHRTSQIAADTSQKMPQRILAPLFELKEAGHSTRPHSFVVALWMHFLRGESESSRRIKLDDPLRERLGNAAFGDDIGQILSVGGVFPPEMATDSDVHREVDALRTEIASVGVAPALAQHIEAANKGEAA